MSQDIIIDSLAINKFIQDLELLFREDKYIARSDYIALIKSFEKAALQLFTLNDLNMLKEYALKMKIDYKTIMRALTLYENIAYFMEQRNNVYVKQKMESEKEYLDGILSDVDSNIKLDSDQKNVVLSDEDYTLVIAGAGAGKTTTIAAKVRYLVEKKKIKPEDILIISFTNKAVQELKDKINKALNIPSPITTFHAAGYSILRKDNNNHPIIVKEGTLYYVVTNYLKTKVLNDKAMVNNLILFFSTYFKSPLSEDNLKDFFTNIAIPFTTLKSDLLDFKKDIIDIRKKKRITISNENVRSYEETIIANFLYLNNIDYVYEPVYKYNITGSKKPYTPDFYIKQGQLEAYLEHFGISEDGKNSRYNEVELAQYKKNINDKIMIHKKHGTKLIYTFSKYNDGASLLEHLEKLLLSNGFVLNHRSEKEILEKIISTEEAKYITKLTLLIVNFISNFKVNGYTEEYFSKMYNSTNNVRSKLFLKICLGCYLEYQKMLKEKNAIDFADMINESARLLNEARLAHNVLNFKYIIVDEYQDISKQRFDLTKALSNVCNAKIMAVGDDWQAIYAFSGSDIELFTKFQEKLGYAKIIKIVHTYRNGQELIDIAGNFVQKNDQQIKKALISPKHIDQPIIIYTYDSKRKYLDASNKTGANYNLAVAVTKALEHIINNKTESNKILLLTRFNFDANNLQNSGLFEIDNNDKVKSLKYPNLDITIMTAHSSKGLGYDNVIIINGKNATYGFPAKINNDPVLSFVVKSDRAIEYAEERRLFYVALTRTKNRVYCIAPMQNPSPFLLELQRDYHNVVLNGTWNEENLDQEVKRCPICNYPLQYRISNAYGIPLYICTNESELCGFMTNDLNGGNRSIEKCPKCYDGYLIVKHSSKNDSYFWGCTNYAKNGQGCSYCVNIKKENKNTNSSQLKTEVIITKDMVNKILECILGTSTINKFGINTYVKILKGSKSKKIIEHGLMSVPHYGEFYDFSNAKLVAVINRLIESGYISQTMDDMPVLELTNKGLDIVKNKPNTANIKIKPENILATILQLVEYASKTNYFDRTTYLSILKGIVNEKIMAYRLNESSFFGVYQNYPLEVLDNAFEQLLKFDYLLETKCKNPVIHLTSKTLNRK